VSDTRGPIKLPNIVTIIMLILTTVSLTYALSTGGRFVSLVDNDKEQQKSIQELQTAQGVTAAKLDALQASVNRVEAVGIKTQELMQQHALLGR
jgi:hypothetical protein